MPEPDGPQFQNHRLAATHLGDTTLWDEDAYERDGVRPVWDEEDEEYDEEPVSRCGYCGDVSDYCQGHGEDERAAYGFEPASDEYDARRAWFEEHDYSQDVSGAWITTQSMFRASGDPTDRDAYGRSWEVEASGEGSGPDYSQPDPFDRSDPEQARQAEAIEAMNKLWEE